MKKIILLLVVTFFVSASFSQENALKMTNLKSKKEIIIKENKRIRIKTSDGQKFSGRFKILNNQAILINNNEIELASIEKIKRNPLFLSIATDVILIYAGVAAAIVGVALAGFTDDSSTTLLIIPAAGLIYAGIKSPNFLKGYKKVHQWEYEFLTISK